MMVHWFALLSPSKKVLGSPRCAGFQLQSIDMQVRLIDENKSDLRCECVSICQP